MVLACLFAVRWESAVETQSSASICVLVSRCGLVCDKMSMGLLMEHCVNQFISTTWASRYVIEADV